MHTHIHTHTLTSYTHTQASTEIIVSAVQPGSDSKSKRRASLPRVCHLALPHLPLLSFPRSCSLPPFFPFLAVSLASSFSPSLSHSPHPSVSPPLTNFLSRALFLPPSLPPSLPSSPLPWTLCHSVFTPSMVAYTNKPHVQALKPVPEDLIADSKMSPALAPYDLASEWSNLSIHQGTHTALHLQDRELMLWLVSSALFSAVTAHFKSTRNPLKEASVPTRRLHSWKYKCVSGYMVYDFSITTLLCLVAAYYLCVCVCVHVCV